jgi:hypothetical protein
MNKIIYKEIKESLYSLFSDIPYKWKTFISETKSKVYGMNVFLTLTIGANDEKKEIYFTIAINERDYKTFIFMKNYKSFSKADIISITNKITSEAFISELTGFVEKSNLK